MKLRKVQSNFTQVSNVVLNDKNLSWKAKGVYAYLYSKPDGWDFSSNRICNDSSDGRKTVLSALKELETAKYLTRKKLGNGRVEYNLDIKPECPEGTQGDDPKSPKGTVPKELSAQKVTISNTELDSNTDKESNKAFSDEKAGHEDIVKVIDAFIPVNSAFKRFYKDKTQRRSCSNLIMGHGLEKVIKVVTLLSQTNQIPYFPKIHTPYELEGKWTALEDALKTKKNELTAKRPKVIR
jgi:hypothetical protein